MIKWIPNACEDLHRSIEALDFLFEGVRGKIRLLPPEEGDRWIVKFFLPELEQPDEYPIFSLVIDSTYKEEHFVLIPHPRVVDSSLISGKSRGFAAISVDRIDGEIWVDQEPWAKAIAQDIAVWAMGLVFDECLTKDDKKAIRREIDRILAVTSNYSIPIQNYPVAPIELLAKETLLLPRRKRKPDIEVVSLPAEPIKSDWGTGVVITNPEERINRPY